MSTGQAFIVTCLPERAPFVGRVNHTLTVFEGQLYRFGGRLVRPQIDVPGPNYGELETLVPVGCTWSPVIDEVGRERQRRRAASEPAKRGDHIAVVVDSKLFVFGGRVQLAPLADMFAFDFFTQKWGPVLFEANSGPGPIFGHCAAASSVSRRIYVTGGWHSRNWRTPLWAFETTTNTWIEIPRPPHVLLQDVNALRRCAIVAWEGTIYVVGWPLTPTDTQPFISKIPILAYSESRNEWSEVAAIGNPPGAILCTLPLANPVVMSQLGCWTFLCVGDNDDDHRSASSRSSRRAKSSSRGGGGSGGGSSTTSTIAPSSPTTARNSSSNMMSSSSMIHSNRPGSSLSLTSLQQPQQQSSLLPTINNTARSGVAAGGGAAGATAAAAAVSGVATTASETAGAVLMSGTSHLPRKSTGARIRTPTLWSFHFATSRWIQHPLVMSPTGGSFAGMDHQMNIQTITSHLCEQNTDPFETKYALVATGSDTLMLWGACLDRDHLALRLKLSEGPASKVLNHFGSSSSVSSSSPTMVSIAGAKENRLSTSVTGSGKRAGTSSSSSFMNSTTTASGGGPRPPSFGSRGGVAVPLSYHRQMRNAVKNKSNALRLFDTDPDSSNPVRVGMCPIVRVGSNEQVQKWRTTHYLEQLDWLFAMHSKDRRKTAAEEAQLKAQQQPHHGHHGHHGHHQLGEETGGASSSASSSSVPRFMRATAAATSRQKQDGGASSSGGQAGDDEEVSVRDDEFKHRKHAPVTIEMNTLSNASQSIAWPLFVMRNLPSQAGVPKVRLRWELLKRYVRSGWASTRLYPPEVSLQGWKDGRRIPSVPAAARRHNL